MFCVWAFCHTTDINTIVLYASGFDNELDIFITVNTTNNWM
jgi:hypothetical protein